MGRFHLPSGPLAALLLLSPLMLAAGAVAQDYVRVVDRPWQRVGLSVTVTDRQGRPVRGLRQDDFRVSDSGERVELADFGPEEGRRDRPLSVAVLLDLSESMGRQVRRVREAANALLGSLRSGDEIMVAKFNDQMTVLQPFTSAPGDTARTLDRIGRAGGGTAIFRAVEETLKDVRDRPGRKVILVVSDGYDNDIERDQPVLQSLYLQDLLRLCLRTGTIVYGVRPGLGSTSWLPFEGFVEQTGGRLFYTGGDLPGLFARLGEEFLSQYYVAYDIDPKVKEGKWRRIRVEVTRDDLVVKTMQGYFTPRGEVENLVSDLSDRDAEVRADAAYDLGFVDDERARSALRPALGDRDPHVRRQAIGALARLREEAAIPEIVERLGDKDEMVRNAAVAALEGLGPGARGAVEREVSSASGRHSAGERERLAIELLGRIGDERAIEPLTAVLKDGPEEVRAPAARALGEVGLGQAISGLRSALKDPAPGVRRAALQSIVRIAGSAARPIVEDYLRSETDPSLRAAAQAALDSF